MGGSIIITNSPRLSVLTGFRNLRNVQGDIVIESNPILSAVDFFMPRLQAVRGAPPQAEELCQRRSVISWRGACCGRLVLAGIRAR